MGLSFQFEGPLSALNLRREGRVFACGEIRGIAILNGFGAFFSHRISAHVK
jgi:hypothetical protein